MASPYVPHNAPYVPFWIYDITNIQLITNIVIPSDISDRKTINTVEANIPKLNYTPYVWGGSSSTRISFDIDIINRNPVIGNLFLLKQFETLRNATGGFLELFTEQFNILPQVLFSWGTGKVPLIYHVTKCDFKHKQHFVSNAGFPQYTTVSLEFILDESNKIHKVEEAFRKINSILGTGVNNISNLLGARV